MTSQIPDFVQVRNLVYTLFQEPNSGGRSRQGAPVRLHNYNEGNAEGARSKPRVGYVDKKDGVRRAIESLISRWYLQ